MQFMHDMAEFRLWEKRVVNSAVSHFFTLGLRRKNMPDTASTPRNPPSM